MIFRFFINLVFPFILLAFGEFSLRVRLPILSEKPRTRGAKAAPIASRFRPFTYFPVFCQKSGRCVKRKGLRKREPFACLIGLSKQSTEGHDTVKEKDNVEPHSRSPE
jgi:hypothetical protein